MFDVGPIYIERKELPDIELRLCDMTLVHPTLCTVDRLACNGVRLSLGVSSDWRRLISLENTIALLFFCTS
jgi:hypothetical protein